jgi:hypothetical protein
MTTRNIDYAGAYTVAFLLIPGAQHEKQSGLRLNFSHPLLTLPLSDFSDALSNYHRKRSLWKANAFIAQCA